MRNPKPSQLKKAVDKFNKQFPVGTPVVLRTDAGSDLETVVEEPARVLGGHSAVAWLQSMPGCYAVERVRARETDAGAD